MNRQRLLAVVIVGGLAALLTQTFSVATKELVKKSNLGPVAAGKAEKAVVPSRTDYAILQMDPAADGRDAGPGSINSLVFKLGRSAESELGKRIESLRQELSKQESDRAVAEGGVVALPPPPDRCEQLQVSAIASNGAFIDGRFRELGEEFIYSSYPVRVLSTAPEQGSAVVVCNRKQRTLS